MASSSEDYSVQNPQPQGPANGRRTGSTPSPDPTTLTTEQLTRQIANLKELLTEKIEGANEVDKVRFEAIDHQFEAIEAWRREQKIDTKVAVDAALSAAEKGRQDAATASEKAIAKSETAFSEQSKQQAATLTETTKGLDVKLNDLKERVLRMESVGVGVASAQSTTRQEGLDARSFMFALVAAVGMMIGIGVAVVSLTTR